MLGANSTITYDGDLVHKEVTYDELEDRDDEAGLKIATLRECYMSELARDVYEFIPEIVSVKGTLITMRRVKGEVLIHLINRLVKEGDNDRLLEHIDEITKNVKAAVHALSRVHIHHRDVTYENIII